MKITKLGSTVIVDTGDAKILTDPCCRWCYYGSWCNYPNPNKTNKF